MSEVLNRDEFNNASAFSHSLYERSRALSSSRIVERASGLLHIHVLWVYLVEKLRSVTAIEIVKNCKRKYLCTDVSKIDENRC